MSANILLFYQGNKIESKIDFHSGLIDDDEIKLLWKIERNKLKMEKKRKIFNKIQKS